VFLLIPFHTARIFDIWEPNYVKNAQLSSALSYLCIALVGPWHMPLLFVLAGAATWLALRHRSGRRYVAERFRRLFVPLIFGVLVVVPPQGYLARVSQLDYQKSYLTYLADYFGNIHGDLSGYTGLFTPAHLWFILYLFDFSLIALPLFLYLRGEAGRPRIARLVAFLSRPGAIFMLAVPLFLTEALPAPGGKNPFFYALLFVYGYILLSDTAFQEILDRHGKPALVLGAITMTVVLTVWAVDPQWSDFSWPSILFALVRSLNTWFWIVALLALGHRFLNFTHTWYAYANQAAYPFYILHQTVIMGVGFYVVRWDLGPLLKFFIIAIASLALTVLLYDVLVRRSNVTRFLFGMKPH